MAVVFNEPTLDARRIKRPSFFARLVMGTGLARTPAGAQAVMLILAILFAVGAFFLFVHGSKGPPAPTPAQVVI